MVDTCVKWASISREQKNQTSEKHTGSQNGIFLSAMTISDILLMKKTIQ